MGKSLPKIIMIIVLIFSSFLMFNNVSYTTSANNTDQEISFSSPNKIIDNELVMTDFQVTP